ncbi:MAG: hypothetical protein DMF87_05850 [Acidobacteria bacterium]|nr:MAG: hypothetical protein DMF88_17125 [Acidobacteriota bacterium]PYR81291.1 MAG: hypothetical protein DMF87_05850 [Acidobacteriota bacterium]
MPTAERVLIIEDDESLRDLLERTMVAEGHEACAVADSEQAIRALAGPGFDLVLSDFDLPGKGSTEVLQAVRARARDVPVVLITEQPQTDGLAAAAGQGPTHYVTKPVDLTRLRDVTGRALRTRWFAKARRRLVELAGDEAPAGDVASLGDRFDSALEKAYMLCQPIVRWSTKSTFAYEALVRSKEPTIPHPGALFDAGDRLDRVMEIGRRVRHLCGESVGKPPDALLFVNIHTKDLMDHVIFSPDAPLTRIAKDVVIEITERARLEDVPDAGERIARLRGMGYRIAIDDLGAGYAGLTSFASLEPDFMKLDRALVQDIHQSNTKSKLVGAMLNACRDLGVEVVGEGIELQEERDAMIALGCDLFQGFLFARPGPPFPTPQF